MNPAPSDQQPTLKQYWLINVGLSTDPSQISDAEEGVKLAYDAAGLRRPNKFIWSSSPASARPILGDETFGCTVWTQVLDQVRKHVVRNIIEAVGASAFSEIEKTFESPVLQSIRAVLRGRPNPIDLRASFGCHEADCLAPVDFCGAMLGLRAVEPIAGLMKVASNAGWWWPFEKACVITDRPNCLGYDNVGRLHSENGAALSFRDGWKIFMWHGVQVPSEIIMEPEKLTANYIVEIRNAEVRHCALERFGVARFLRDANAEIVHQDHFGVLFKKQCAGEKLAFVKVTSATHQRDSTSKEYFLRVPPRIKTARGAVAWTFDCDFDRFDPTVET